MLQRLPQSKSYHYRRAMPQQEQGGRTWRFAVDTVKHGNGRVTSNLLASGVPQKRKALQIAHEYNKRLKHAHP